METKLQELDELCWEGAGHSTSPVLEHTDQRTPYTSPHHKLCWPLASRYVERAE